MYDDSERAVLTTVSRFVPRFFLSELFNKITEALILPGKANSNYTPSSDDVNVTLLYIFVRLFIKKCEI